MDAPPAAPPAAPAALPAALPSPRSARDADPSGDGLSAEVRESLLLLVLSLAVTVGLAGAVSAALSLLA